LRLGAFGLALGAALLCTTPSYGATVTYENRTPWANFDNPGYTRYYTVGGVKITDHETSSDPSNGGSAVQPSEIDIASGSVNPGSPGAEPSVWYGYYNGGTPWNPNDPSTMNDDYLLFRLRVGGNPKDEGGNGDWFSSYHWNILIDIDNDGYKEYWLDLDGSGGPQPNKDPDPRLRLMYSNDNTQEMLDPVGCEIQRWIAMSIEDSANLSHTRAWQVPGSTQWYIDVQIPMRALDDKFGNQQVYPDTPIRFLYSTSASNTDPLQKDWLMEAGDQFRGDPVSVTPIIHFTDRTLEPETDYYYIGDKVYVLVRAQNANTLPNVMQTITVTVTDPSTGDTETLTLRETGPDTGIFSNQGAATAPVSDPDNPNGGWIPSVRTYSTNLVQGTWRVVYNGATWDVYDPNNVYRGTATAGTKFTSSDDAVEFTVYEGSKENPPQTGDEITFYTYPADPLPTSASASGPDNGTLTVAAGDWIMTRYVENSVNYDDWAQIYAAGSPIIRFTRANGTDAESYQLTTGTPASDPIYVEVVHAAANTSPTTVQTISVTVTGTRGDSETITLTETGVNTGIFRNTAALPSYASATPTTNDGTFQEYVGGIATATYTYGGTPYRDYANILVPNAGTVAFVTGNGLYDVTTYSDGNYMYIKVFDSNYGVDGVRDTLTVTVTSPTGDSETVTLLETGNNTHTFMNTNNDLVTTAGSAVVTSASATFQTDGVLPGDKFVIITGLDIGTYTVESVNSQTSITLTQTLTTSRTGLIYKTTRLLQARLYDGAYTANDRILEANNRDILTVTYVDGDPIGTLTDTATFGASPTLASVLRLEACATKEGQVVVEWETGSEFGTAGFYLLRLDEASGKFVKVGDRFVPGLLTAPQGGTYRLVDPAAKPGGSYTYQLVEVEAKGSENTYGPFNVQALKNVEALKDVEALRDGYSRSARPAAGNKPLGAIARTLAKASEAVAKESRRTAKAAAATRTLPAVPGAQPAVKLAVRELGLYYVSGAEIAPLLGIPRAEIANAIRKGKLLLTCQGKAVPYLPADGNAGILFYGQPIKSVYTDENVYWLQSGNGLLMSRAPACGAAPDLAPAAFAHTTHAEANKFATTALFTDPGADFWLWDYLYVAPRDSSLATKSFPIAAPDAAPAGSASLIVRLKGALATTANPDHHARISINGTQIGEGRWDGTQGLTLTLPFNQQLLQAGGANSVTVQALADTGAPYSMFYVDSFDLTYQRLYLAVDGSLLCRAGSRRVVTIGGFAEPAIRVLNVADPGRPVLLDEPTIEPADGAFAVTFPASQGDAYYALNPSAVKRPASVEADVPSRLAWKGNKADYLVIAPAALMDGAKALAAYRQAKRFETMVVDLEDVYDEFAFGIADPHAVQRFLAAARSTWKAAPRYVVLAGNGTYDYKNYLGYGDNLLPPLMMATDYGLFASDGQFAPGEGVAIGRLPAVNAGEMAALVGKIAAYEAASGEWTKQVILAADKADLDAGLFPQDSDDLAGIVPAPYSVDRVYLSQLPLAVARAMLLAELNDGAFLFNYIGHGNPFQFASQRNQALLTVADVASLANGDRMPVVTAFTCLAGRFELPGTACLGKALVLKGGGGGIAFWGPSALSENNDAKMLAAEFFRRAFGPQEAILGDVVLKASAADPQTALIYQLLGDPALRLRRP